MPCDHQWVFSVVNEAECLNCGAIKIFPREPSKIGRFLGNIWKSMQNALTEFKYFILHLPMRILGIFCVVMFIISALIFHLVTYDYVIAKEPTGNIREAVETVSCTHYDYCYGFKGIDSEGMPEYGFRYGSCPGDRLATKVFTEYEHTRKSGKQSLIERSSIGEYHSECK